MVMGCPDASCASSSDSRSGRDFVRKSEKEVRLVCLASRSFNEGAEFCWKDSAMKEKHRVTMSDRCIAMGWEAARRLPGQYLEGMRETTTTCSLSK